MMQHTRRATPSIRATPQRKYMQEWRERSTPAQVLDRNSAVLPEKS